MDYTKLKQQWMIDEKAAFYGWDFQYLDNRWEHDPLHWDYKQIIQQYLQDSSLLLDMGTGGGEFLLTLNHPYLLTSVTEGYKPNFDQCQKTLSPLGIDVRMIMDDDHIPFEDSSFDIVINRHESFNIQEVKRILKPEGIFITQQVGGDNDQELVEYLGYGAIKKFAHHHCFKVSQMMMDNGFTIVFQAEDYLKQRFLDVGAIVYYAKIIEWLFPDFSVDKNFAQLCKLHQTLLENGYIECTQHRFIIVGKNGQ